MRTRALRWTLVFACLFALSVACGDSEEPDEGAGGEGGTGGPSAGGSGGPGGAGGSGGGPGSGGTGGKEEEDPFCGDGNLDPGEDCDDGNEFDNDGCSSTCKLEGTCEAPYNFRQMAILDAARGLRLVQGLTAGRAVVEEANTCSAGARSMFFRYKNGPERGFFRIGAFIEPESAAAAVSFAIRTQCEDPSTEALCRMADNAVSDPIVLAPEEEIYLVADVHESVPDDPEMALIGMGVSFAPVKGEGDDCDVEPDPNAPVCLEGLACGAAGVCEPEALPVITDAQAYRDPDDGRFILLVDGTDDPGNTWGLQVVFLDDAGNELAFAGYDFEELQIALPDKDISGKKTFRAEWVVNDFGLPATRVQVSLVDRVYVPLDFPTPGHQLTVDFSESVERTIGEIPRLGHGQPCDFNQVENKCVEGLSCRNNRETGNLECMED